MNSMVEFHENYDSKVVLKIGFYFFGLSRSSDKERKVGIAFSGKMQLGLLQFERQEFAMIEKLIDPSAEKGSMKT